MRRVRFAVPAAILSTVLLAGCGDGESTGSEPADSSTSATAAAGASTAGPEHNDADLAFAQQMIPHHEQAVEMAELATSRAESQPVKDLAADIAAAQQPEITLMTGWLAEWEAPLSAAPSGGGMDHGMGHGAQDGEGMMSEEEMTQLQGASGSAFDSMFLTMMIAHHEGAIAMAQTEQADGENDAAVDLAASIEQQQETEIDTMKSLQ